MIAVVVPLLLCLLSGSAALALMWQATFRAATRARLAGLLLGAAAATAGFATFASLLWSVLGELVVHFGDRRPAPLRLWPFPAGYAVWAGALLLRGPRGNPVSEPERPR